MPKKSLDKYSIDELERALAKLKQEKADAAKPKPQANIDWSGLMKLVEEEGINPLASTGIVDEDLEHFVFEKVMTTIYGKDIWNWWEHEEGKGY